jgi:hypothetical protein
MFDFLRLRTLLVLRPLQSFTRAGRCYLSVAAPPLGFGALQRLRSGEPTQPGFAAPGTLRLQGSSALLAPSFSPKLHGLVSCRARSWASPFEAFPFAEREPPLGGLVPTCRSLERPAAFSTFLARLLGLARSGSPLPARGEVPTSSPLLPWASPLQGFLPDATAAGFPTTSSHGLGAGVAACSPPLRVSIASGPVRLRGDHRPSWGSCTSFRIPVIRSRAILAYGFTPDSGDIAAP